MLTLDDCTLDRPPASLFPPTGTRVRSPVGGFGFVVGFGEDGYGSSLMVVKLDSGEYASHRSPSWFEIWYPPSRRGECDRAWSATPIASPRKPHPERDFALAS